MTTLTATETRREFFELIRLRMEILFLLMLFQVKKYEIRFTKEAVKDIRKLNDRETGKLQDILLKQVAQVRQETCGRSEGLLLNPFILQGSYRVLN